MRKVDNVTIEDVAEKLDELDRKLDDVLSEIDYIYKRLNDEDDILYDE